MERGGSRVGAVKARMYCRTKSRSERNREKYAFFFLKSVAWKVGQYNTAIRNAAVCFVAINVFS